MARISRSSHFFAPLLLPPSPPLKLRLKTDAYVTPSLQITDSPIITIHHNWHHPFPTLSNSITIYYVGSIRWKHLLWRRPSQEGKQAEKEAEG